MTHNQTIAHSNPAPPMMKNGVRQASGSLLPRTKPKITIGVRIAPSEAPLCRMLLPITRLPRDITAWVTISAQGQ